MQSDKEFSRCAYPWQQMIIDLTGEVVPCCFWAGYGNTGKQLGNTNTSSLEDIWRGEGYRSLRKAMASGNLNGHPCGNCMAYRWSNGVFPKFSWPAGFVHEHGYCYLGQIPEEFTKATSSLHEGIRLFEDDRELSFANVPHDEVRNIGLGRYSVWHGWLYFSSSDNSNPLNSGRQYTLVCGDHSAQLGALVVDSESGRNLKKAYDEYVRGQADVECEPSMISFISTADCNIDCPSCSQNIVRVSKIQHRPETVSNVLAKVSYLSQFIWHGGEPYLIKRFRKFVDDFSPEQNPNLAFGFTSNGTMINADEADKLKKFPRINASVSIDSFNRETFRKIRSGASFDRVWENVRRLLRMHNAPTTVFSVGMIVCKSNFAELAENLRFAIENDVGLNLSPVVVYPVVEQINVFSDFHAETAGWQAALDQAATIVEQAKAEHRAAVARIDPSGMVEELRRIFEKAQESYRDVVRLRCEVDDRHDSIRHMRRPAIVVYVGNEARSYVELTPGNKLYELEIPTCDLLAASTIRVDVLHNVMEVHGTLMRTYIATNESRIRLYIPRFVGGERPRNIEWATYGISTPDGINITDPGEINDTYRRQFENELAIDNIDLRRRFHELNTTDSRIKLVHGTLDRIGEILLSTIRRG